MRIVPTTNRRALARVLARDAARDPHVVEQARLIVQDVRRRGDAALRTWMRRLDRIDPPFVVTRAELRAGWRATPREVRRAIRNAAGRIRRVAARQMPRRFRVATAQGVRVEQRVQPLARVGCYVPAGRHPLPSTVLMTVVPARVAGVTDVTVVCPRPTPEVLCAAVEAGAARVLRLGGAQAIAALAYGTPSIAKVDKIVGPGNAWVAAAKRLVALDCPIDFDAGPSEIVVWSESGRPDWIAADLIAQAEHDPDARALLVTTSDALARRVRREIQKRMPDAGPAAAALDRNGALIVARDRREAIEVIDALAPEHLVCDRAADAADVRHAGTIFVGEWSVQAAGDYATGSNHVLPTGGAARTSGGLSAADFTRVFTVQTVTREGLRTIGPDAVTLADAEGLHAHADSIRARLQVTGARRPRS